MGSDCFGLLHPKAAISVDILYSHPLDKRMSRKAKIIRVLGAAMESPGQEHLEEIQVEDTLLSKSISKSTCLSIKSKLLLLQAP